MNKYMFLKYVEGLLFRNETNTAASPTTLNAIIRTTGRELIATFKTIDARSPPGAFLLFVSDGATFSTREDPRDIW